MDIFLLLFIIGAMGIVALGSLSFGHFGIHHGQTSGTHPINPNGHSPIHHAGPHGHSHSHQSNLSAAAKSSRSQWVASAFHHALSWFAFSPLDIFVYCLGAGATGLIVRSHATGTVLGISVVIGALLVRNLIFQPVARFVLKFESKPSEGLEGSVAMLGTAATTFDKSGRGIVRLELEGQIVQLLANLDASEVDKSITIKKGDEVVVIEVDGLRNRCKVSRELMLTSKE